MEITLNVKLDKKSVDVLMEGLEKLLKLENAKTVAIESALNVISEEKFKANKEFHHAEEQPKVEEPKQVEQPKEEPKEEPKVEEPQKVEQPKEEPKKEYPSDEELIKRITTIVGEKSKDNPNAKKELTTKIKQLLNDEYKVEKMTAIAGEQREEFLAKVNAL